IVPAVVLPFLENALSPDKLRNLHSEVARRLHGHPYLRRHLSRQLFVGEAVFSSAVSPAFQAFQRVESTKPKLLDVVADARVFPIGPEGVGPRASLGNAAGLAHVDA